MSVEVRMASKKKGPEPPFPELLPPLTEEGAIAEAQRCLECGGPVAPPPCMEACPAEIFVPRFIKQIQYGDYEGAAKTIFTANVLGGTCARVCPVEELCEGACVLISEGRRPVAIGRLQRFATDWALENEISYLKVEESSGQGRPVAVIGAGPAGLSCAAELAKLGYMVTIFESSPDLEGGLVTHAIAPYKQHIEPLPEEAEEIRRLGVEIRMGVNVGEDITIEELESKYEAIFLGIGMDGDVQVDWEGGDLEGIYDSLEFIEQLKLGDRGKLQVGERVAVIGGGNTAIDVAREAIRLGAKDVIILYRRTEEQMPAFKEEVKEARAEGVHFYWLTAPQRFIGEHHVRGIECIHMRLGEPDASGRPRPEPVPGTEFVLEVDTVIKAIGQRPREEFLKRVPGLELEHGLVKIDKETGQTTNPKYFAGGDCINGGATVVEAVRDGKIAARGIHQYLMQSVTRK